MIKKTKSYTLMFIPENNGKTFTLRLNKILLKLIVVFVTTFFVGLLLLILKTGEIATKLQFINIITAENVKLEKENKKLNILKQKIDTIDIFIDYIENLILPQELSEKLERSIIKSSKVKDVIKNNSIKYSENNNVPQYNNLDERIVSIPNLVPVNGWITRHFSSMLNSDSLIHQALDFAAKEGSPIKATAPGIVEKVQNDKYFGLIVTVSHEYGFKTKYGHCSQILVSENEKVNRGQTIALVGNTGRSTAPHLHYEILKDEKNVDPINYMLIK